MNAQSEEALLEKLKALPPARRAEVEDFVDFLKAREEGTRDEAAKRLGEAFRTLDALNPPPLTSEEVQAEVDAARAVTLCTSAAMLAKPAALPEPVSRS